MKPNFLTLACGFLLLLAISNFIIAQDANEIPQNSAETPILKQNLQTSFDESAKSTTYTFTSSDSALQIGENKYWNIQPGGVITADSSGEVIAAEFTVTKNGETYVFGADKIYAPPNSKITFKDGKISIDAAENSEFKEMPVKSSSYSADSSKNTVEITGKNLNLQNENTLQSGKIISRGGNYYIVSESRINNIDVRKKTNQPDFEMQLFFDGKKHEGISESYISMNPENAEMYVYAGKNTPLALNFMQGNPFVELEENNRFMIKNFAFTEKTSAGEIALSIKKEEGKIPEIISDKLNMKTAFIINGEQSLSFTLNGKELALQNLKKFPAFNKFWESYSEGDAKDYYSTPIAFTDSRGEFLKNDKSVIMGDNNEAVILRKDSVIYNRGILNEFYDKEEVSKEDIKKLNRLYPNAEIKNAKRLSKLEFESIADFSSRTPMDMRSNVKELVFEDVIKLGVGGVANERTNSVVLGEFSEGVLTHELSHILFSQNLDSNLDEWSAIQGKGSIEKGYEDYDVEGYMKFRKNFDRALVEKWPDGSSGPKNGFINPYGKTLPQEDIATFVEKAYFKPEEFSGLLDYSSPAYDPRYKKKLDFLYFNNYIPREVYEKVVKLGKNL